MHASSSSPPRIVGPGSGRMLPTLVLSTASGEEVPLWRYRTRSPLVILLHRGPADLPWLHEFAARYAEIQSVQAEALAVGPSPLEGLPFLSLVDRGERLRRALGLEAPGVIVADRPGEVWAAWSASQPSEEGAVAADRRGSEVMWGDDWAGLPALDEVITWIEYAQSECRECFCCERVWPDEWVRE